VLSAQSPSGSPPTSPAWSPGTAPSRPSPEKLTAKQAAAVTSVGRAGATVGIAAAAALGGVVYAAANFDSAMSNVQAATHESAAGMDELRAAALQAGADTVFSASEAAEGIENLAKAGVSTADILGGALTGSLDLAAAGQISVAATPPRTPPRR
jgi:hypothetical protein